MHVERRWRWLVISLLAAIALVIVACGATPSSTGGGTSPGAKAGTSVSTARAATAPTTTHTITNTSAQIVLMPGASHYGTSDSISVVVRNTSGQTIYAVTHFTDCSIISLEILVGSNWQPVSQCADGVPHPSVTRIAPGAGVTIQMSAAMAGSNADGSVLSNWPAGTYRARLTYATSESAAIGQGAAVYSATFGVG